MSLLDNALENLIELDDLINLRKYKEDWESRAINLIAHMHEDLKVVKKTYEPKEQLERPWAVIFKY